ncbi:MAG: DNA polymerase III subunit beta [Bdellovibrionales bacterium]
MVEKRNTMPILVNVLLEAKDGQLTLFSTDLEVSLTDSVPAEIIEAGRSAVNAKSLFDIVKELPSGELQIETLPNHWMKLTKGTSEFNIVGISPDEYPVFPTYNTKEFTQFNAKTFSEMIEKTIYSVSNDETRYHLNGVYFENSVENGDNTFRMVATDGHRLSVIDRKIGDKLVGFSGQGVIIPRKGLNEIRKIIEGKEDSFEMAIEGAQLIVKTGSTVLMIRLIEGKYPNYQQLIPQSLKQSIKVRKDELYSTLKRVSLLSNQKSKGVTFSLSDGKMQVSSNNPEMGDAKEEINIDYSGDDFKIGFNAKYILDALSSISEESITLEMNDQLSPGLVKPEKDRDYTCVVMPMRI